MYVKYKKYENENIEMEYLKWHTKNEIREIEIHEIEVMLKAGVPNIPTP